MRVARQSFCLEESAPSTDFSASMAETTMLRMV